jgi:surface protein
MLLHDDVPSSSVVARTYGYPIGTWDASRIKDFSRVFDSLRNSTFDLLRPPSNECATFNEDLSGWNVSAAETMFGMFAYVDSFNQNLFTWDVSRVKNMSWMFLFATDFNQDLSSWTVSQVTDMSIMFYKALAFNQDLSSWEVSQVKDMSYMFYYATAFNQDLSNWNVSRVTDMSAMFAAAFAFNQVLSAWNISHVTSMGAMFAFAIAFNQDLCSWGQKVPVSVVVKNEYDETMFGDSGCPITDPPDTSNLPAGPWCHQCVPFEHTSLVLDGPPFEMLFLSENAVINFQLTDIASNAAVACETKADNGNIDLCMKEGKRPTIFTSFDIAGLEASYNCGSNEHVSLTTQETADICIVAHAFSETSNAAISCCTRQGPCLPTKHTELVLDDPPLEIPFLAERNLIFSC